MSDNVADPLEQLSLAYKQFGETMADSISKTYETGVRYGAGMVSNQMNAMNAWAAGGWDMLFGFFPHNKATNIAIANAYYSLVNLMVNYPAEAMTRYYEEHDFMTDEGIDQILSRRKIRLLERPCRWAYVENFALSQGVVL